VSKGSRTISQTAIHITIRKTNSTNLTVIDLPGFNYEEKNMKIIREIIKKYFENPRCIIVLVTQCVVDLAGSEGIELINTHDPDQERTVIVYSKADQI
jgi:GTP-binding protein EngB required for normal cell division